MLNLKKNRNMETLNENEVSLVLEAVNNYWYVANDKLSQKDLGDIERKNWEDTKRECGELLRKLGSC